MARITAASAVMALVSFSVHSQGMEGSGHARNGLVAQIQQKITKKCFPAFQLFGSSQGMAAQEIRKEWSKAMRDLKADDNLVEDLMNSIASDTGLRPLKNPEKDSGFNWDPSAGTVAPPIPTLGKNLGLEKIQEIATKRDWGQNPTLKAHSEEEKEFDAKAMHWLTHDGLTYAERHRLNAFGKFLKKVNGQGSLPDSLIYPKPKKDKPDPKGTTKKGEEKDAAKENAAPLPAQNPKWTRSDQSWTGSGGK